MTSDHLPSSSGTTETPADAAARLGRRRFITAAGAVAGVAGLTAAGSLAPSGVVDAALPAGASRFEILPKAVRLADTRPKHRSKYSFTFVDDKLIRVKIAGRAGVPANATAVVLTVTAVNFGAPGHVTVSPYGTTPTASNLNLEPYAVNANLVTVKVGSGGRVDVASHAPGEKIVDVLGYYAPVSGAVRGGRFVNLSSPRRAYDSRIHEPTSRRVVRAGSYKVIDLNMLPPNAGAVMLNLTIAASEGPGHFTALPSNAPDTPPSTSSVNASGPGDTRAAGVIVPIADSRNRRVKIYAHVGAFVIVDVFGYYTSESDSASENGLFVPITPLRLIDTRKPGQMGRLWPDWVVEVPIPQAYRARAAAIAMNVTGVDARRSGHFTVSGARMPIPNTSNLNCTKTGQIVPNHAVSTVTPYGFQVYSSHGAYVLADMAGYFVGVPRQPQLPPYKNPPPPGSPPNWILRLPRLGLTSTVMAGDPNAVTNAGHSWHWTGTGYVGQVAHVSVFAHRTEYGGPYRNLHLLQNGDTATLQTGDGRLYTYRMVRRDLVWGPNSDGPPSENILAATRRHDATTLSLVACTRTDWQPTSLNHRMVVTFELLGWREV